MALSGYSVKADSPVLERRLWDLFPVRCLRFWPWMLRDAKGLGDFLERDMPVTVSTQMSGMGRFETVMRWLTPWFRVQWGGRLWCVSREWRMWEIEGTAGSPPMKNLRGPLWHLPLLEGKEQLPLSGVFDSRSFFPVEAVAGFLDEYGRYEWFKAAGEITWDHAAGTDLFRLKLTRGGQNFEILIQRAKYVGQDLGAAIENILKRLSQEGGDHLIDATYKGKVLLRSLPGRPKEGSLN
ncbi:MAG: hypothetical protein K6E38_03970 [Fretibacterium sp.]|nr:hypothetical protein [Fretibacterium sp.]